jgi:hypothetical protein
LKQLLHNSHCRVTLLRFATELHAPHRHTYTRRRSCWLLV